MSDIFSIKHSHEMNELASALSKAQGEMQPAAFNRVNPHYKNRYADFTSCMDACRQPLSKNGLAVSQLPNFTADGKFVLTTLLVHCSGQWMACEFPMNTKNDNIQAIGSAMSYAKRYSLCGMLGIVADEDVDDDGNSAVAAPSSQNKPRSPKVKQDVSNNLPEIAISEAHAAELSDLLALCSPDYQNKFFDRMRDVKKVNSISMLPESDYEITKKNLLEKSEEYQNSLVEVADAAAI